MGPSRGLSIPAGRLDLGRRKRTEFDPPPAAQPLSSFRRHAEQFAQRNLGRDEITAVERAKTIAPANTVISWTEQSTPSTGGPCLTIGRGDQVEGVRLGRRVRRTRLAKDRAARVELAQGDGGVAHLGQRMRPRCHASLRRISNRYFHRKAFPISSRQRSTHTYVCTPSQGVPAPEQRCRYCDSFPVAFLSARTDAPFDRRRDTSPTIKTFQYPLG